MVAKAGRSIGGFHPQTIAIAQAAFDLIQKLEAKVAELNVVFWAEHRDEHS